MATKLYDLQRTVSVVTGAGFTFDPLLIDIVGGVEAAVAPDIVIPVPKAAGASAGVLTAMGTGNLNVRHNNVGAIDFDILSLRAHSIQRALTGVVASEVYSSISNALAIANGAGTDVNPALLASNRGAGGAQIPQIAIPVPKTVPTLATTQSYLGTVLAVGNLTFQHSEGAPVNHDILALFWHSIQDLQAAVFGSTRDQRRYFTILNAGPDAAKGAVYEDDDDTTRQFRVDTAKVSADGSTLLSCTQVAGTTIPTTGGADILSLVTGTGDANIAYTGVRFEKLLDLRTNTAVANGAGLTFDPGLVENGVPVMPDIVIPVPKAVDTVPYVATNLAGAVGTVTVQHQGGAPINHDILSLRAHSIFRDV